MAVSTLLRTLIIGLGLSSAAPAMAKSTIEVPTDSRWQHFRSQLVLPTDIGELKRTSIEDFSDSELNVAAQYASDSAQLTLYLYRPYWPDVGAWFERSEAGIFSDKAAVQPQAESSPARAFARPNGTVSSGLRRSYTYGNGRYKTSVLAIVPFGGWLLKVRYSAVEVDLAATNAVVDNALAALVFPKAASEGQAAQQIMACTQPYKWKKAKIIRDDMMSAMLAGGTFISMMESNASAIPSAEAVCRMDPPGDSYTIYRELKNDNKFWMLVGDAGATAHIQQVEPLLSGGKQFWSVLSIDTRHQLLPAFNRMPEPEQWLAVILSGQTRATTVIDPDAPADTKPETTIHIAT
jgi:hypothetical protein